jgi:hypothetical protein
VPIFVVERGYAEQMFPEGAAAGVNAINDEEEIRWIFSFLSTDRLKSYCLYEAESAEAIRRAAIRAGLPADVITEVAHHVLPDGSEMPLTG